MKALFQLGILIITFNVAFLGATAFLDFVEHHMGYYNQGIQEASEVGK